MSFETDAAATGDRNERCRLSHYASVHDPVESKEWLEVLWTIAVILLVLWLLGLVSGTTINGFIHILLVVAIIVVLIRIIQGRSVV